MTAKDWRRRINLAVQAVKDGKPELMQNLCEELAALTAPKCEEIKAVPPMEASLIPQIWAE